MRGDECVQAFADARSRGTGEKVEEDPGKGDGDAEDGEDEAE